MMQNASDLLPYFKSLKLVVQFNQLLIFSIDIINDDYYSFISKYLIFLFSSNCAPLQNKKP